MPRLKALALMILAICAGCKEEILHDLDEQSANRVQLALLRSGIEAEKSRSGDHWAIAVAPQDLGGALQVVESSRALRRELLRPAESGVSMLMSREERAQAFQRANAFALERTLEALPHVLEAHVHVGGRSASVVAVIDRAEAGAADEIRGIASAALGIVPELLQVVLRNEVPRLVKLPLQAERLSSLPLLVSLSVAAALALLAFRRRGRPRSELHESPGVKSSREIEHAY